MIQSIMGFLLIYGCASTRIHHPLNIELIILQSAPFGLIPGISQEAELFTKLLMHDVKTCRIQEIILPTIESVCNNPISPSIMTDLTLVEIVSNI